MEKKTFLKGAAILGIAGLIVQIMGAVFRIPLANIIGPTGMGYYQTAYPIYVFLLIFSTNGAPAAISKMTSERIAVGHFRDAHNVFKKSFSLMALLGSIAFLCIFLGAEKIVNLVGDPGAVLTMKTIAPALLLVPIMSVYRGYFQGMQDMMPTALSQLAEQGVRVIVGLSLAILLVRRSLEQAAAGATLGTSVGPIAGLAVLALIYGIRRKNVLKGLERDEKTDKESSMRIIKELLFISVPITIGVSILPIMNLADLILVMKRLEGAGFNIEDANMMYGQLTGMAGPIINIPMALALSMALSMVPAIAAAKASKDSVFLEKNIKLGFRTAMIVGVPCSFGLIILAKPIMMLLYPLEMESAAAASGSLAYMAMGVIFLCVAQTMAGALQGLGRPGLAASLLGIAFLVKFISNYILTSIPSLNIEGAALASALGFLTAGLLNFIAVKNITSINFDRIESIFKPLLAGLIMFIIAGISYRILMNYLGNSLATLLAIVLAAFVYTGVLIKSKAIREEEISSLPKGAKLSRLLKKIKLL